MQARRIRGALLGFVFVALVVSAGSADDSGAITAQDTRSVAALIADLDARGVAQPEKARVLYEPPEQDHVRVATMAYDDSSRALDVYYPPNYTFSEPLLVVIVGTPMSDVDLRRAHGVASREFRRAIDWASHCASTGVAAVVYSAGQPYFSARRRFFVQAGF